MIVFKKLPLHSAVSSRGLALAFNMGKGERPEHVAPPEVFYDDNEAAKYTTSSRVMEIQEKLTARALELLALPDDGVPKFILDVGCGSGLSGQVLTEQGGAISSLLHVRLCWI